MVDKEREEMATNDDGRRKKVGEMYFFFCGD